MKMKYTFSNFGQRDVKSMLCIKTDVEGTQTILIKVKKMPSAQILFFSWASSSTNLLTHRMGTHKLHYNPFFFRFIYPTTYLTDTLEGPQIQGIQDGIPHPIMWCLVFSTGNYLYSQKLRIIPDSSNNASIQLVSPPYAVPLTFL